jgi:hypothetical protein
MNKKSSIYSFSHLTRVIFLKICFQECVWIFMVFSVSKRFLNALTWKMEYFAMEFSKCNAVALHPRPKERGFLAKNGVKKRKGVLMKDLTLQI